MNKKLIYAAIFAFSLGITSCSLDEDVKDQLPEEEGYKNPQLIYLNTVANLYTQIGASGGGEGIGGTDRGLYDISTFTADEAVLPIRGGDWEDGGLWKRLFTHTWDKSEGPFKASWDYLYKVIGLSNRSVDKLNELIEKDPSNIYLPIYKSEVRAVRAIMYYYLLDLFARVPIVESSKTTIAEVKQNSRSEVFAWVVKELQESAPFLPNVRSNFTGEYYGRVTRPVAYTYLAKLALNAQVYNDNDWTDNGGVPNGSTDFPFNSGNVICWDAAVNYCDSVATVGYQLTTKMSDNFKVKNETSSENIFTIPMDPNLYTARMMYLIRSRNYAQGAAYNQGGWNGAAATLDAYNAFTTSATSGDIRKDETYYYGKVKGPNGDFIMNGDVELEYKPEAVAVDVSGSIYEKTAGARMFKYEVDLTAQADGQLQNNDYVIFRYADILLMKAEAKVRKANGASAAGQAEFDEVRSRSLGATKTATLDNILTERMLEFAWEGVRRQDLVRFGKFTKAISGRPASEPYRNVFPIPAEVDQLNDNITQNAGY